MRLGKYRIADKFAWSHAVPTNFINFLKTIPIPAAIHYLFILDVKKEVKSYVDSSKYFTSFIIYQDQNVVAECFHLIRQSKSNENIIFIELLGLYRLLQKISNIELFYGKFENIILYMDNQVVVVLAQGNFSQPIRSSYKKVTSL